MISSRQGFRQRRKRKKASRERLAAKTEAVRAEAKKAAAGRSAERRRARIARYRSRLEELRLWIKGVGLETRRRARLGWRGARRRVAPIAAPAGRMLRPVAAAIASVLRPLGRVALAALALIAPYASAALFLVLRAVAAFADLLVGASTWSWRRLLAATTAVRRWSGAHVTPARAAAAFAAAAAVALAAAQFIDYRGVAIGGEQFQGGVAPPSLDRKQTGEPYYYLLAGLAVAALVLTWLALNGRPLLGRVVAAIGAVALVLTLAVNLPQGLDTGGLGEEYEGTEASLLAGFWIQLVASMVLALSGAALSHFASPNASARGGRRTRRKAQAQASEAGEPAAGTGAGA